MRVHNKLCKYAWVNEPRVRENLIDITDERFFISTLIHLLENSYLMYIDFLRKQSMYVLEICFPTKCDKT